MKSNYLFALWAVLFSLCAAFGFIPEPEGALRTMLTGLSLAFFLPPAWLLYRAKKTRDDHTAKLIRNLSALSLGLTLVLLIGNFLTAFASDTVGLVLYYVLIIVSSPMICSGHWAMSLFLWACLLVGSLRMLKRQKHC